MSVDAIVRAACALVDARAAVTWSNKDRKGDSRSMTTRLEARDAAGEALDAAVAEYRADCAPREWTCEEVMRREG